MSFLGTTPREGSTGAAVGFCGVVFVDIILAGAFDQGFCLGLRTDWGKGFALPHCLLLQAQEVYGHTGDYQTAQFAR